MIGAALSAGLVAVRIDSTPSWLFVLGFAAFVIVGENTSVFVHPGTGISPSFMAVMASVAVLEAEGGGVVLGATIVGACGGVYLVHVRTRRFGMLVANCAQFALASFAAALTYQYLVGTSLPVAAAAAISAFTVINATVVVIGVALYHGEGVKSVWADVRPTMPNYLAFGLLGLLMGLISVRLGPAALVLLAVPMAIGRWTFRSFLDLEEAHDATIRLFIRLIESKDGYTAGHTERVAKYATYIGEELRLPAARLQHLRQSALMHDVGKLAVPTHLLNKPGRLTANEYEAVRRHNDVGIGILAQVDFMRTMAVTASDRHGHFAPALGGVRPELVQEAHMVAVADAFDAMTSTRSYRQALGQDVAFDELRANAGTQFDPECVNALVTSILRRNESYGLGHEQHVHPFAVPPPVAGVGSAGLGDLTEDG